MDALAVATTIIHYTIYPIIYVLSPLLPLVLFITAPIIHLGHSLVAACAYPYHFLTKFEVCWMGRFMSLDAEMML